MCGIFGYNWTDKNTENIALKGLLHRGPDSQNVIAFDQSATLGHLRLKIIDLSGLANQPFTNENERIYVATNGVIYNYKELRKILLSKGHLLKSHGDCEIIVHLYEEFGLDGLKLLDGQFALAIFDKRSCNFILYRDPQGIKPLYYFYTNGRFAFASEARVVADMVKTDLINENAFEYIRCYGYNIGEESHYKKVFLLQPGHVLVFNNVGFKISNLESLKKAKITDCLNPVTIKNNILDLISKSVEKTLISDEPIAVIVSGGLDSSIILDRVAHCGKEVVAFAIGERCDNEFDYARYITNYYDIPLKEVLLDDYDIDHLLVEVMRSNVIPQDGGSLIPKWVLAKHICSEGFKVVLGGTGADECWGGYTRHEDRYSLLKNGFEGLQLEREYYLRNIVKLRDTAVSEDLWQSFIEQRPPYDPTMFYDYFNEIVNYHSLRVDAIFMAHEIEYRVPFLDKELVKLSLSIPYEFKFNNGIRKYLLRSAFNDLLPERILNREKKPLKLRQCRENYGAWLNKCISTWRNQTIARRTQHE